MRRLKRVLNKSNNTVSKKNLELKLHPGSLNLNPSFVDLEIISINSDFSFLYGQFQDLWCVDREIGFALYSLYTDYKIYHEDEMPQSPLKKIGYSNPQPILYKEKINQILYLISKTQEYIGLDIFGTGLVVSTGNFQQAIWFLLNQYPSSFLPNQNVSKLVNDANTNGQNFSRLNLQFVVIVNKDLNSNIIKPRTQPYILAMKPVFLQNLNESKTYRILRKQFDSKFYGNGRNLPPSSKISLTPGYEFLIKDFLSRKTKKISGTPGQIITFFV